jgi:hypothetical protein
MVSHVSTQAGQEASFVIHLKSSLQDFISSPELVTLVQEFRVLLQAGPRRPKVKVG